MGDVGAVGDAGAPVDTSGLVAADPVGEKV